MATSCQHAHPEGPLGEADVSRALVDAHSRAAERGERMTPARTRVLEMLLTAGEPVKAYDLIAAFGVSQPAKPPTVYRALDFLERLGLAHRIASISAYVACNSGPSAHAAAFLICDCCGTTAEVETPVVDDLHRCAEVAGYVLTRTTIEAHGLCQACR